MTAFRERGRILFFNHSRYEMAEQEFLRALADNPDDAEAHAMRGLALNRLGRFDDAIAACREAIRLAPEWSYPHYALGYVLEKNNRLEEAAQALVEAIRISPHTAYFHSHLAFTRHRQGRYADALTSADEGLRCDGQHVDSLNRRAMALAALDRFEEAEQTSRIAVALDPQDSGTLANLGYILSKRRKATEALEVLREALRLDPSMTWSREVTVDTLVWLVEQGRVDEAVKYLPEAVRRDPNHAADRKRLADAAVQPLVKRLAKPITIAWCLTTACVAAMTTHPLVIGAWLFFLGTLALLIKPRRFVLVEPLAYPWLRRDALGRLAPLPRRLGGFVALCFLLGATLVAAAAAAVTHQREWYLVLFVAYALILPAAYAVNPSARAARDQMVGIMLALVVVTGAALHSALTNDAAFERLKPLVEAGFVFGVGGTGLLARVFRFADRTG